MKSDVIEELFLRYYNDALLYVLSLTKNKAQAEDVVSAAFYKALRGKDEEIKNFKPWLMKVCRNVWFDAHRRRKREVKLTDNIIDESESAIEKIIKGESHKALYKAIDLLPEAQKEVVILFYFEELRIKDVTKIVGKSEDSVKVLLYRARENLKTILETGK